MQVVSVGVNDISQNQLIAMATPSTNRKRSTNLSSALKALSYGEKIVKIGPVYPEMFD